MINRERLLADLKRELPRLEADILRYSEEHADLEHHLREQYQQAMKANRTAEHFVAWREAQITQAAAAWVLTCVFVRFLEDNGLLDEPVLSGPVQREDGSRPLQHAKERITHHFDAHPADGQRNYLLTLFRELEQFPALDDLLDSRHNPLWQMPLSDDGAKRLVDFFQAIDPETGELIHDFTDPDWDTRFLGDLYQDISESVRKRYALLQTPEFVEEFILDYTLTPAIDTFGLEGLRLIDPTCGSGHFLLTTFEHVFDAWQRREPATNARHLAQRALDVVHGVDINPYAVAIAKFRLLIAAMKASHAERIRQAPDFHFHLAVGDSLLHGKRHESVGGGVQRDTFNDALAHVFETEDRGKLEKILGQRYHVVVGNPPYITVKDKALNDAYRALYSTCHRQYSLGVPFTERFFDLTCAQEGTRSAGYVGLITANSFMKREFGKKLIKDYLPKKDLTHLIDTSGAYIPGHGTPTVLLFCRNRSPSTSLVRTVQGIRGEPRTPASPSAGLVWSSIVKLVDCPGTGNSFVSSVDLERQLLASHPWSIGGGGASELKHALEAVCHKFLGEAVDSIGFASFPGSDEVFVADRKTLVREGVPDSFIKSFIAGEWVRDWGLEAQIAAFVPYNDEFLEISVGEALAARRRHWCFRTTLETVVSFGAKTRKESGDKWWCWYRWVPKKYRMSRSICFAFVATHNHFVLDRGGKVFNRSAPVIKLPADATEADHLQLLGLLNSSIAMFWMRQVFHGKGQGGIGQESRAEWEEFREFTGTGLQKFPVAEDPGLHVLEISQELDNLATQWADSSPESALEQEDRDLAAALRAAQDQDRATCEHMIGLQEELDWACYKRYGLVEDDFCFSGEPPPVALGQRAFEIALARRMAADEVESTWFQRHGSTPITDVPDHWPADYRELIERRLATIENNRWIKLVEQPEYKRRWNREPWEKREQRALQELLLDRLEKEVKGCDSELITCARLADQVRNDARFQEAAVLYAGNDLIDLQQLVVELVAGDEVPQMAAARLKPTAIKKFRAWQETWDKQRLEDAIDAECGVAAPLPEEHKSDPAKVRSFEAAKKQAEARKTAEVGTIAVPPKYASSDFRKSSYWSLRGKLDVPKERFFSLPGCEKPGDTTLVIGWAGLNHLQRAQAIAAWYVARKEQDGWQVEQLLPMLVALEELLPWLKQWHNDLNPEFGERMGDFYEGFLFEELRQLDLTREALFAWQPAVVQRKGRRKAKA